jgi:cytoskeletal protein CcmA (bactofilin family)
MKVTKNNGSASPPAFLSIGVELAGDILFAEELQVEGKVTGKLISETGILLIQEKGRVEAQVNVGVCIIRGTLNGNVNAASRIEIYKTGRVCGDLTTPVLLVEEGALINGTLGMGKETSRQLIKESQPDSGEDKSKVKSA